MRDQMLDLSACAKGCDAANGSGALGAKNRYRDCYCYMAIVVFFILRPGWQKSGFGSCAQIRIGKGRLYEKGRRSISMEIWGLLNKGFGYVREVAGDALIRGERAKAK